MERGKEEVIPLDEKTMEEIGKQILNHCDFKSIELQERIDKAIEYIKKHKDENDYVFLLPSELQVILSILGDKGEEK